VVQWGRADLVFLVGRAELEELVDPWDQRGPVDRAAPEDLEEVVDKLDSS